MPGVLTWLLALVNGGAIFVVGRWVYSAKEDASDALDLLKGQEEFEDDGVIPRLRSLEDDVDTHEDVLEERLDVDLDAGERAAD